MEEAINEHLMIIDALNARMRTPAPTMARHLHAVAESIFWRSRERRMLTASAAPHPAAPPASSPTSSFRFSAIPFPRFPAAFLQSSPCAMTRAFVAKCFSMPMH
ncbi:MAG: hypothetical protein ACLSAH_09900 [Bilophila wadsworthia]